MLFRSKAREEGDVDTETEAMQRLAALTSEQAQVEAATQQREAMAQQMAYQQQVEAQQTYQAQLAAQQAHQSTVDPRVEDWAERNPWYGRDTVMTHAAWGIHRQLIQVEGVDPSSSTYYDELDRRIREAFPGKFQGSVQQTNRPQRPVQTVAQIGRAHV